MERTGQISIRPFQDRDAEAWNAYVHAHNEGTFFHRIGWREIFESVFRLKTEYLIAEEAGKISGILPLVSQSSVVFGKALVSLPFCVEAGPLFSHPDAGRALDDAAIALNNALGSRYVEYRGRKASRPAWRTRSGLYATFVRDISADDERNLLAIPRKQRAVVRKTLQSGLISHVDEQADRLYAVYSESVRNLGTPVFSRRYFPALQRVFGRDCDIVVITDKGEPVSAVLNFYFRDTVMPYYGGGTPAARHNGANDFLYWEVMRRAAARGYRVFDFGRSKANTGPFSFKKNWGFEPQWLEYEYYLQQKDALPEKNPSNPKYSLPIETWKRLPLPVANFLGPYLVRNLG